MTEQRIRCINASTNEVKYFIQSTAYDTSFQKSTGFLPEVIDEDLEAVRLSSLEKETEQIKEDEAKANDREDPDDEVDESFPLDITSEDEHEEVPAPQNNKVSESEQSRNAHKKALKKK